MKIAAAVAADRPNRQQQRKKRQPDIDWLMSKVGRWCRRCCAHRCVARSKWIVVYLVYTCRECMAIQCECVKRANIIDFYSKSIEGVIILCVCVCWHSLRFFVHTHTAVSVSTGTCSHYYAFSNVSYMAMIRCSEALALYRQFYRMKIFAVRNRSTLSWVDGIFMFFCSLANFYFFVLAFYYCPCRPTQSSALVVSSLKPKMEYIGMFVARSLAHEWN